MKALQIKIMAYLQDCYLLDIDHSYKEYVIFELKYDHSDDFFYWAWLYGEISNERFALSPWLWQVRTSDESG